MRSIQTNRQKSEQKKLVKMRKCVSYMSNKCSCVFNTYLWAWKITTTSLTNGYSCLWYLCHEICRKCLIIYFITNVSSYWNIKNLCFFILYIFLEKSSTIQVRTLNIFGSFNDCIVSLTCITICQILHYCHCVSALT